MGMPFFELESGLVLEFLFVLIYILIQARNRTLRMAYWSRDRQLYTRGDLADLGSVLGYPRELYNNHKEF
jgi:hypothetical protein